MDKITKKLISYFVLVTAIVVIISSIIISFFLSKIYINIQYNELEIATNKIYELISDGNSTVNYQNYNLDNISAVLVKDGNIQNICGKMYGISKKIIDTNTNDIFENHVGEKFISFKSSTDIGDIIAFKSYDDTSQYIKYINLILCIVFLVSLIFSILIGLFLGKRFTTPILKLKKAALEISNENFNVDLDVNTKDEIQDLSQSLKAMSEELNHKNTLQKEFIANVSHDFKTPLAIIRGYSEAIKDGLVTENDAKEYSNDIITEVDRLNALVLGILEVSKYREGKKNLNLQSVPLDEYLNDIWNRFTLGHKNIHENFHLMIDDSINAVIVTFDPEEISRVLYNFLTNSISHSTPDTDIILKAISTNSSIKISVIDYGEGISKEHLTDVWTRYYKGKDSGGMGLGLPICSEILKAHGFNYNAESTIGNGSEFYFEIPTKS
ncbi:MAG: HAMP domain-containing sensor histidine kinase [Clostridium sp.]|uniref:sensor histidine kinase n=1 Tax=Clostridium sp. TaxID=1506 RepID=UPI003032D576